MTTTISLPLLATRLLITFAIGAIAAYAAAQAEKAGNADRKNRRMALELEALGPFLAPLPVEEQNKFRLQIGDRTFGHEDQVDTPHAKESWTIFGRLAKEKELRDLLLSVIKTMKPGA